MHHSDDSLRPQLIDLPTMRDTRGNLCVAQSDASFPFEIKRCYWICDVPAGAERGGHAHISTQELLVPVSGSFVVHLDDGHARTSVTLSCPTRGLLIKQGIWRTIDGFSGGSVCLVLASELFSEEDYIRDYGQFVEHASRTKPKTHPFLDLGAVNNPCFASLKSAAERVIKSGRYIGGPEVEAFETSLSRLCDAPYAVGVSNGLDALRLIFRAYLQLGKLQPGDEVIVPANTYIASVLAVTDSGLKPRLVDPDPRTCNLSGLSVAAAVSPRTRAILTVHLYGRVAWDDDMAAAAREHNLLVVEDNAQAIGAQSSAQGLFGTHASGSLGHASGVSFYPTKNLGALGDAGAVVTHDARLAEAVRALANYGADCQYHNIYPGLNCRLDPMQAAMLSAKLPCLSGEISHRRLIAGVYMSKIKNSRVMLPEGALQESVWHQFVVRVDDRVCFREYLKHHGVETAVHYPVAVHKQPCYAQYADLELPVSEMLAREVVSLPINSAVSAADAAEIADIINGYTKR